MGWSLAKGSLTITAQCNLAARVREHMLRGELADFETRLGPLRSSSFEREFERGVARTLRPGQAYFSPTLQRLYFVDSADRPIGRTLQEVCQGMGLSVETAPISTDEHGIFVNGRKSSVPTDALLPLRVALRLLGVELAT